MNPIRTIGRSRPCRRRALASSPPIGRARRRPGGTGPARARHHDVPAFHRDRARPAAAHHPAVHPLPGNPSRVLGQPPRRPDSKPAMVRVLLPGTGPGPLRCDPLRWLRMRECAHRGSHRKLPASAASRLTSHRAALPSSAAPAGKPRPPRSRRSVCGDLRIRLIRLPRVMRRSGASPPRINVTDCDYSCSWLTREYPPICADVGWVATSVLLLQIRPFGVLLAVRVLSARFGDAAPLSSRLARQPGSLGGDWGEAGLR